MKNLLKFMFMFLAVGLMAVSCDDDDEIGAAPVITNLEVGSHHDHDHEHATKAETHEHEGEEHVGHIGEDICVQADIMAANKIAKVVITIHKEEDHDHATKAKTVELDFSKEFTVNVGEINGKFHQHIDIPANTEPGHYHFHFKVVDQAGLTTEKEVELHLEVEEEA